jgi:mono/diheme cytochrome c family protein
MPYRIYCSRCHGEKGAGDGPSASSLATKPQSFTDCAAMGKISDDTLFKAIKDGGAAVGLPPDMPAWGQGLDDNQIHAMVSYLRDFCKK